MVTLKPYCGISGPFGPPGPCSGVRRAPVPFAASLLFRSLACLLPGPPALFLEDFARWYRGRVRGGAGTVDARGASPRRTRPFPSCRADSRASPPRAGPVTGGARAPPPPPVARATRGRRPPREVRGGGVRVGPRGTRTRGSRGDRSAGAGGADRAASERLCERRRADTAGGATRGTFATAPRRFWGRVGICRCGSSSGLKG